MRIFEYIPKTMKKLLVLFAMFGFTWAHAQVIQQECATALNATWQNKLKQKAQYLPLLLGKSQIIPVPYQIHLVKKSNGTGVLTLQDIYKEIDSVNYFYANANMFFYECAPPDIIMDDSLYDYEYTFDEPIILSQYYTPNVLNMYFPNTAALGGTAICGYSKYPPSEDLVVISASCAKNGSTLAHEIGHYFGLMHTHEVFGIGELVDGSNCSSDGDFICDTPADPTLSSSNVSTACAYTGTSVDANGMPYMPDVRNIMSYSRKVCRDFFSPMQYAVINSTQLNERSYLYCNSPLSVSERNDALFRIYPNPVQTELNFEFTDESANTVSLYNMIGDLVFKKDCGKAMRIDTRELPAGIYTYHLQTKGQYITGKWIKVQ